MEQPGEAALFDQEIAVLSSAFRLRKPDAFERANRLLTVIDGDLAFVQRVANARMRTVAKIGQEAEARAKTLTDRRTRVVGLVEAHKNMNLLRAQDEGMTPERAQKGPARINPAVSLFDQGKLTHEQLTAALEATRIYEAISRAVFAKIGRMDGGGGGGKSMVELTDEMAWLHAKVYKPWTAALYEGNPNGFAMIVDILIDGRSIFDVSRDHSMAWDTCLKRLVAALDLYVYLKGMAPSRPANQDAKEQS